MIVRKTTDYKAYCKAMSIPGPNRRDPLTFDEVVESLSLLVGHTVRSTDGCYGYRVTKKGVKHQGETLGKSMFDGLLGWVCTIDELTDLIDELELDGDVERSLFACGMNN